MTGKAKPPSDGVVFDAAMRLIAARGWRQFGLTPLAGELGIGRYDLALRFGTRYGLLRDFGRFIDQLAVSDMDPPEAEISVRDRLFDVLMQRFDALRPYRDGLRALAPGIAGDPGLGLLCAAGLPASMAHMLAAAGAPMRGSAAALKASVLAAIWLATARVWFKDESEDLSKTMAALDRHLDRIEGPAKRLFARGGPCASRAAPVSEETAKRDAGRNATLH